MARIFTEGFENGDGMFFTSTPGGYSIATDQFRSGARSLRQGSWNNHVKAITPVSEFFFRFGFKTIVAVPQPNELFQWRYADEVLGSIRHNSTKRLEIYVGGTLVATSAAVYGSFDWYLMEIHIKIADSAGVIDVLIDGVQAVTYAGDTKPSGSTQANNLILFKCENTYYDDVAMNDTSGAVDNSWCGDGRVVAMFPSGNGDASQLTGSDGNSTDNYALVDEVPSNNDTDYVEGSVVNERDLYQLSNVSLPVGTTVRRVVVESRSKDTVAEGGLIALEIKTGGTEYASADMALASSYAPVRAEWILNPNTGVAWTQADLDALQVGPRTRS